jgi:isoamylase
MNATFDWSEDKRPMVALPDMVIYEAHIKGLTIEFPGLPEADRGRYLGASHTAVISHLKRLESQPSSFCLCTRKPKILFC